MELSKDKINKLTEKYVSRTNVLAIGAFALVLLASIIFSIPSILIDPKQVFTMKFLTKELISISITLAAMACWIFIGRNSNAMQPRSQISLARRDFKETRDIIQNNDLMYSGFEQWIEQKFQEEEQHRKDRNLLRSVGIKDLGYLKLDFNTLEELLTHSMKIDNYYYKQLSKEQYNMILFVLKGKSRIKFIKWSDYLSERTYNRELEISEILSREARDLRMTMYKQVFSKVLFGFLIGAIFISVVVERAVPSEDTTHEEIVARNWEVVINLISRLFNAIWSAFMGYLTGKKINDEESMYINYKHVIHKKYINDKNFKPKTEQELAREEWLKEEKEKNKQANEEYAHKLGLRDEDKEEHNEIIAL